MATNEDSYFKKLKKRLKESKQDRGQQFANYLNMMDSLESKKFYSRRYFLSKR